MVATLAVDATSVQAQPPSYGGIGATVAGFNAAHQNGPGQPPAGITYYRIEDTRAGV